MIHLVMVAVFILPRPARGQEEEFREQYRIYSVAVGRMEAGDCAAAVEILLQLTDSAYEPIKRGALRELGFSFHCLDEETTLPNAWYYLKLYFALPQKADMNDAELQVEKEARGKLEEIEQELQRSHRRVPIQCSPDGVEIFFGDEVEGPAYPCPLDWWFTPGTWSVHGEKPGYTPQTVKVEIVEEPATNAVRRIDVSLTPDPGELRIEGVEKGRNVFIDGALAGVTPLRVSLASGEYSVAVIRGAVPKKPGSRVTVLAGGVTEWARPPAPPKPRWRGAKALRWSLLGTGAAVAMVGGVLHVVAGKENIDLHNRYPDDLSLPDYCSNRADYSDGFRRKVRPKLISAYALYGVGGAAALSGAFWILIHEAKGWMRTPIKVGPPPTDDAIGASLSIGF